MHDGRTDGGRASSDGRGHGGEIPEEKDEGGGGVVVYQEQSRERNRRRRLLAWLS